MLEFLFVALFQVAAGDPEAIAPAQTNPEAAQTTEAEPNTEETLHCERRQRLGTRVRGRMVCRTVSEEQRERENAQRLHDQMTAPAPNPAERGASGN